MSDTPARTAASAAAVAFADACVAAHNFERAVARAVMDGDSRVAVFAIELRAFRAREDAMRHLNTYAGKHALAAIDDARRAKATPPPLNGETR
jgi:hypothetical protein